jgi:hypothetical protein
MLSKQDIIQQQALNVLFLMSRIRRALEYCQDGIMPPFAVNQLREAAYGDRAGQLVAVLDLETEKPIDTGHILYADVYEMLLECLERLSHHDDPDSVAIRERIIKTLQRGSRTSEESLQVTTPDGTPTLTKNEVFEAALDVYREWKTAHGERPDLRPLYRAVEKYLA